MVGCAPDEILRSAPPYRQPLPPLQASFCHVAPEQVLTMHDVSNIWRVPLMLQDQGAHTTICSVLGLGASAPKIDMQRWKTGIADKWDSLREVRQRGWGVPASSLCS